MSEFEMKHPNAYLCDNWVVIFLNAGDPHYRILTGMSGGYLDGDSWRMNSGIVRVEEDEQYFYFHGASGSCYAGRKTAYCLRMNNAYIWAQLKEKHGDKVSMLDEDTDWMNHDWIIK